MVLFEEKKQSTCSKFVPLKLFFNHSSSLWAKQCTFKIHGIYSCWQVRTLFVFPKLTAAPLAAAAATQIQVVFCTLLHYGLKNPTSFRCLWLNCKHPNPQIFNWQPMGQIGHRGEPVAPGPYWGKFWPSRHRLRFFLVLIVYQNYALNLQ